MASNIAGNVTVKKTKAIINNYKGFTLIELMISVAIVAILASIAIPSYQQYIIKTNRTQVMGDVEALARELEKGFAADFSYSAVNGGGDGAPIAALFPATGPVAGDRALYDFQLTLTDTTYLVEALPIAGGQQAGDGKLTISHSGRRCWHRKGGACELW